MKYITSTLAVGSLFISSAASAALITADQTSINSQAQSYSTSVSLAGQSYSDVTIDLIAKGDYGYTSNENIKFYIDGDLVADWTYNTAGISVVENYSAYDYTLSSTLSITDTVWDTWAADGILDISWTNGYSVHSYPNVGGEDYVSYAINGMASVPEPLSLSLLGLGLAGLGMTRKLNRKSA